MTGRLTLVVMLHVDPDAIAAFEEYETRAAPLLSRHGGRLESRIHCSPAPGAPHEVHVVSFPDAAAFDAYRADPEYAALAEERSRVIRATTVIAGSEAPPFGANTGDDALRIVGLDHVYLSVTDMARSEAFYDAVMQALGFHKGDKAIAGEPHAHYFNPFLQISLRPARSSEPHDSYRAGLHHLCLQAEGAPGVDEAYARLSKLGVAATPPRKYAEYNPDYYATFFEDPDGIRLEIVGRTPHRERLARRWNDLRVFLNPVAELLQREPGA
jgi:catechol 2,3-dioxygenase-like lactoylglutathione lyase family enzyme/uncharacterized protein (DUF1330 family)